MGIAISGISLCPLSGGSAQDGDMAHEVFCGAMDAMEEAAGISDLDGVRGKVPVKRRKFVRKSGIMQSLPCFGSFALDFFAGRILSAFIFA